MGAGDRAVPGAPPHDRGFAAHELAMSADLASVPPMHRYEQ